MHGPDWVRDPRFETAIGRKRNEDELAGLIAQWTLDHEAHELMRVLQSAGVPPGVVQKAEDFFNDRQLEHRERFGCLDHPVIALHAYHSPAYRLFGTACDTKKPGLCLGEDNKYVFKQMLGLSDDEIADLLIEGVVTTDTDLPEVLGGK